MGANGFTVEKYKSTLQKLKEKDKLSEDLFWFNIVTPFFQGLRYDLHDFDVTDYDAENKVFSFRIDNGKEHAVVSAGFGDISVSDILEKGTFSNIIATEKESVHYLQFDIDTGDMVLYTILRDIPYEIMQMELGATDAKKKYDAISRRLNYPSLMQLFANSGFSYFTSIIVIGQLNKGTYVGNKFIEEEIYNIFKDPQDDIIGVITDRVYDKHFKNTAMERDKLFKKMLPLKEVLMDVVSDALGANAYSFSMDDYGTYEIGADTPSSQSKTESKSEDNEEDSESDTAGFEDLTVDIKRDRDRKPKPNFREEPKKLVKDEDDTFLNNELDEDIKDVDEVEDVDDDDITLAKLEGMSNEGNSSIFDEDDDDGEDLAHDFIEEGSSLDSLIGDEEEDEVEQGLRQKKDLRSILNRDKD